MMTPDNITPMTRSCCMGARARVCSKCRYGFCPVCDPGIALAPFTCRKCREAVSAPESFESFCTCGVTRVACWSCDKLHCPSCDRVCGKTPYQCTFCGKEDSDLGDGQAPHDMGAVLEVARRENAKLLAGCKACVSAITDLRHDDALSDYASIAWLNLRGAEYIAQAAIDKAEGQPPATDGDEKSGASTKVSSPPSDQVVALLDSFQNNLDRVIADLRGQGASTKTPTQEPIVNMKPTTAAEAVARLTQVRALVRDSMNECRINPDTMLALKNDLLSNHVMTEGEVLHCLYICGLHDGIEFVQHKRDQEPPTETPAQEPEA